MAVSEPDVMAAAATVLSPDGIDPVRDRIVAEVVVAMFKATGENTEGLPLDEVVTRIRMFADAIDRLG